MRLLNAYYTGPASVEALAERIGRHYGDVLIQVFSRSRDPVMVRHLVSTVRQRLPRAVVIGMSCYGTVADDRVGRRDTLLSVLLFDEARIAAASAAVGHRPEEVRTKAAALAKGLDRDHLRCLLLLTNHDGVDAHAVLDGVRSVMPTTPVAGARAGVDPAGPQRSLVWHNDTVTERGLVMVALAGEHLQIRQEFNTGVAPVGRPLRVTHCAGSHLMELDGVPVLDVYRQYLGDDVARSLPGGARGFPLLARRHGIDVALDALEYCEDGSMRYSGPFREGEWVYFSFPHAERILTGASELAGRLQEDGRLDALLVYASASRLWTLGEGAGMETALLRGAGPVGGCLGSGEFSRVGNVNLLLGQSLSVLGLREAIGVDRQSPPAEPPQVSLCGYGVHVRTVRILHGMISRMTDELATANQVLQRERTFYRSLIEEMIDGLSLHDEQGRTLYQSPSNVTIHGWTADDIDEVEHPLKLIVRADQAQFRRAWCRLLSQPGARKRVEFRMRHKQGHEIAIEAQVRNCLDIPEIGAMVVYFRDVTEIKRLEDELRQLATTDGLTRLANRRHFLERTQQEQRRSSRNRQPMAVVVLDLDHFKRINDTLGHDAGDRVLKSVANVLRAEMRDQDLVGRLGGEEFGVLLPETDLEGAAITAERLRKALEKHQIRLRDGSPLRITAPLGVACLPGGEGSLDALLRSADEALYRAKRAGRNCVRAAG